VTLRESQRRNVCRICGGAVRAVFVYDYGREHAHAECLERRERLHRRLLVIAIGFLAAATLAAAWFISQGRFF
jgi:hypothetical protein